MTQHRLTTSLLVWSACIIPVAIILSLRQREYRLPAGSPVYTANFAPQAYSRLLCTFPMVAVFVGCKQGFHVEIAPSAWLSILCIGFVNTGIICYFYFSSIGVLAVQPVAICGYLEPLSAVLLSVILMVQNYAFRADRRSRTHNRWLV